MAKGKFGCKMRKFTLVALMVLVILFLLVAVFSTTDMNADTLKQDPVKAFIDDPTKAWEIINTNPSLFHDSTMLNVAFENDPTQAVALINQNVDLLSDVAVLEKLDQSTQINIDIINNNPQAKIVWLDRRFKIHLDTPDTPIVFYDGKTMATQGEGGVTFDPLDHPGARILPDGSLQDIEGNLFSKSKIIKDGVDPHKFKIEGGKVILAEVHGQDDSIKDSDLILDIYGGSVVLTLKNENDKPVLKEFKGNFRYSRTIEGDVLESDFTSSEGVVTQGVFSEINELSLIGLATNKVVGKILIPRGSLENRFIVYPGTEMDGFGSGNLRVDEGHKDSKIYYAIGVKNPELFCQQGLSCVIQQQNFLGANSEVRFKDINDGVNVRFSTDQFFDKVISENIIDGEAHFISLKKGTETANSEIVIGRDGEVKVTQGRLADTYIGRFDAYYEKDGNSEIGHWSSRNFLDPLLLSYFNRKQDTFTTCTPSVDCDVKYAQTLGRVVGKNPPKTTIIVAGDNPEVAQSLVPWCKKDGCYIYLSRDVPAKVSTDKIVLSGHHYSNDAVIWRKNPEGDVAIPTDEFKYLDLPEGPITSIVFSGCNTVNPNENAKDKGFEALTSRYPNLEIIQGVTGKEKYFRTLTTADTSIDKIKPVSWMEGKGKYAWWVKDDEGNWFYTDGKGPKMLVTRAPAAAHASN